MSIPRWSTGLALAAALVVPAAPALAADPYDLDVIIPLTGPGAFLGKSELTALGALEDRVNRTGGIAGRPLHFVVHDDQTSPQVAVQLANAVIAQRAAVILGSAVLANCNAMAPLVHDGPLLYCFSPALRSERGSYAFSGGVLVKDQIATSLRYLRDRGLRKIAIITSTDATGQDADRTFAEMLALPENRTLGFVDRQYFNPADLSVAAQVAHIKAAQPQVVIVWTTGTPFGTVLRSLRDVGLDAPIVASTSNATFAQMKQYAAFLPKDLEFPATACIAPDAAGDAATAEALKSYYAALGERGVQPDFAPSTAWDSALMVVSALRKLGPAATATQLRDYLTSLRGYVGINGPYDFPASPQRGLGANAVVMVRWDAGKGAWVGSSRPGGSPLR
jgi:branched-chain amino acid transport system substrate-binding protein